MAKAAGAYTEDVLTWLDVLAMLALSAATAVGVRKGSLFLIALLPALALLAWLPPLSTPILRALIALAAGLFFGRLATLIPRRFSSRTETILGASGGFVWGALLALSLWTGLPSEYSVSTGTIRYPAPGVPLVVQEAVAKSPFALRLYDAVQRAPLLKRLLGTPEPPSPQPERTRASS